MAEAGIGLSRLSAELKGMLDQFKVQVLKLLQLHPGCMSAVVLSRTLKAANLAPATAAQDRGNFSRTRE